MVAVTPKAAGRIADEDDGRPSVHVDEGEHILVVGVLCTDEDGLVAVRASEQGAQGLVAGVVATSRAALREHGAGAASALNVGVDDQDPAAAQDGLPRGPSWVGPGGKAQVRPDVGGALTSLTGFDMTIHVDPFRHPCPVV